MKGSIAIAFLILIMSMPIVAYPLETMDPNISKQIATSKTYSVDESTSVIYENIGQINNNDVKFYGKFKEGYIGFCQSKILVMDLQGCIHHTYTFDETLDLQLLGSGEHSYLAHYFLGNRGTYLNIHTYDGVVYQNPTSGFYLISESSGPGFVFSLLSCDSKLGISSADYQTDLTSGESLIIKNLDIPTKIESTSKSVIDSHYTVSQESSTSSLKSALLEPLLFSSYFGGAGYDGASDIKLDQFQNIYVGGTAVPEIPFDYIIGNPGTGGEWDGDVVVIKLSPLASEVEWITYIGGSGYDYGRISVQSQDFIYVCGSTWSTDFPIENAFQSTYGGGDEDAFLLRLNSTGNGILFSTFLGGDEREEYLNIDTDSEGSPVITGRTGSNDFPALNGFDMEKDLSDELNLNREIFVSKFNSSGGLEFSTFLRGDDSGDSWVSSIDIDESGNIFLTGASRESDFPCSEGCNFSTNDYRAGTFVAKISSNGSILIWSALFGPSSGSGDDIAVASDGSVYVIGTTEGGSIPLVSPFDSYYSRISLFGDYYEGFIFRLSSSGDKLLFSSYLGGDKNDFTNALHVDSNGYVYVTGETVSEDFPQTFPYSLNDATDRQIYVLKFDWTCQRLLFSLVLPGSAGSGAVDISVDPLGNMYLAGFTWSPDFPLMNPIQEDYVQQEEPDWCIFILRDLTDGDSDGLDDMEEEVVGTDVFYFDSDFDQLPDGWEVYYGLDPLNFSDREFDLDNDDLSNLEEYVWRTDPTNPDSDFDNYSDGWEVLNGFDPLDPESPGITILNSILWSIALATAAVVFAVTIYRNKERIRRFFYSHQPTFSSSP